MKKRKLLVILAVILLLTHFHTLQATADTVINDMTIVPGPAYGVSKVLQTKCWNAGGTEVTCTGTGQDGEYQKGYPTSGTHWQLNADGNTVTDNATGLMWVKDGNMILTYHPEFDADGSVTWQQALDFVAGMNAGTYINFGYTDWRLPNVKELLSIVNYGNYSPAIGETTYNGACVSQSPWTNTQSNYYWSSTTGVGYKASAWGVDFSYGYVSTNTKSASYYYVRPVRAGQ